MANVLNLWWAQGKEHPLKGKPSPKKGRQFTNYKNCLRCGKPFRDEKPAELYCSQKCSVDSGYRGKRISEAKTGTKRLGYYPYHLVGKRGKEHPRYVEAPSYNALHSYIKRRLPIPETCDIATKRNP